MPFIKNLRYRLRLATAIAKKHYLVIVFGILLGGILAILLSYGYTFYQSHNRPIRKIGLLGQYDLTELPEQITNLLSLGLTKIQPNGELTAGIADTWKISPDGKRYEFFIIPDKFRWSDKSLFKLTDLNYQFQDVTITTTNNSIIFELKEPFSPLPLVLSKPIFKANLVGLGDYRVANYALRGSTVNTIKLRYIGFGNGADYLYRFYPTVIDLILGFNLGEVDYIDKLFDTNGLSIGKHVKVEPYIENRIYTALYFNADKPELSAKATRQALAYAITKPNDLTRAISPYSPDSWVYNDAVKPYNTSISRSLELSSLEENEKMGELTIVTFPQDVNLAQQVVNDWSKIGIKSQIKTTNTIPEDYDVLLVSRESPLEADQYPYWHSTQAGNLSKLRNPRIDKLLEDGRITTDREQRRLIYLDFQRYLTEECPTVFISHPTLYRVTRNSV